MPMQYTNARPLGYQQFVATSLATAQQLTVPAGTAFAIATVEGQPIRWRDDGTAPTASVGMPEAVGAKFDINSPATFRVIETAVSAVLNVTYYGSGAQ